MYENREIKIEVVHKEIDLIQSCISRMANNSFLIKGWAISLIAIVLTLYAEKNNIKSIKNICIILLMITMLFFYLDMFFIMTERKYIKMYEWVLEERKKQNDEQLYDLNPNRFSKEIGSIWDNVKNTKTVWIFYLILIILIILIFFCIK